MSEKLLTLEEASRLAAAENDVLAALAALKAAMAARIAAASAEATTRIELGAAARRRLEAEAAEDAARAALNKTMNVVIAVEAKS
jgi:hypothetical protein